MLSLDRYVKSGGLDVNVIEPLVYQIRLYIMSLADDLVNTVKGEPNPLMILAILADIENHPLLSMLLPSH